MKTMVILWQTLAACLFGSIVSIATAAVNTVKTPSLVRQERKEASSLVENEGLQKNNPNLDLAVDPVKAHCNTYPLADAPSSDYYLRHDADEIQCAGDVCVGTTDAAACTKFLKRVKTSYKCAGSMALNWFSGWSLAQCVDHALNNGWNFFIFGKQGATKDKTGRCWWQRASADPTCDDPDDGTNTTVGCCECSNKPAGGCWWAEDDAYDFYSLSDPS